MLTLPQTRRAAPFARSARPRAGVRRRAGTALSGLRTALRRCGNVGRSDLRAPGAVVPDRLRTRGPFRGTCGPRVATPRPGGCRPGTHARLRGVDGVADLRGFAAGFVLWGAGSALASGTWEALVYDELVAVGATSEYARLVGRAEVAGAGGVIAGTRPGRPPRGPRRLRGGGVGQHRHRHPRHRPADGAPRQPAGNQR